MERNKGNRYKKCELRYKNEREYSFDRKEKRVWNL